MNRRNKVRFNKILILLSVMMLMLLLCGCRTRVTNNTEVTNVIEDAGYLEESYQVRRDELGIPVAETPLFTGWESEDEEYSYDDEYYDEEFDEFDDEEFYDEEYEDDEDDTSNDSTRRTNPQRQQPVRRPVQPVVEQIRVVLDVNAKDAKCSSPYVMIKKGATYGALPEPTRDGYDFKGWYTAKKDGDKISSKTKLKSDKEHTLYAHWKKAEKKSYTVTFDGNGGEDEVTLSSSEIKVKEGGKYGDMPSAKREKYTFKGWFTEADGGKQITSGSKFTANADQTLYAHWEYDPYTWWDGEFKTATNDIDEEMKISCFIDGGDEGSDDTERDFVKDSSGSVTDDDASSSVIVRFIKNYDDEKAYDEAVKIYNKHKDKNPGAKVIVISDKALKGSKEERLLYKMMLYDAIYRDPDDPDAESMFNDASPDLLGEDGEVFYPYIYTEGEYADPADPDDPSDPADEVIEVIDDESETPADTGDEA